MSHPVITVTPQMPITEALNLLRTEHIRRAPVIKNGKMVGIISEKDLLNAAPSSASSLSVWEVSYLINKIAVEEVMAKKVFSVSEDTPIEEAARIMADHKIGGLPVTRGDEVVGMITETNLFKVFLELMGAREPGVRVTALIPGTARPACQAHPSDRRGGRELCRVRAVRRRVSQQPPAHLQDRGADRRTGQRAGRPARTGNPRHPHETGLTASAASQT
ncbi:MAG: CBS domain-containing protein [Anaerolineales bacterium]|nr:CBS domain-containing protein [Anaerolineales bacterium]